VKEWPGLVLLRSWVRNRAATLSSQVLFGSSLGIDARATEFSTLSIALDRRLAVLLKETEHYGKTRCNEVDFLRLEPFFFFCLPTKSLDFTYEKCG
jgi:hypothetical protein